MNKEINLLDIGKMFTATKPNDTMRIMSLCIDALTIARNKLREETINPDDFEKYYYSVVSNCPVRNDDVMIGSCVCIKDCQDFIECYEGYKEGKENWIRCKKFPKGKVKETKENSDLKTVDIDLPDGLLLVASKLAHEKYMSLNDFLVECLRKYMEKCYENL